MSLGNISMRCRAIYLIPYVIYRVNARYFSMEYIYQKNYIMTADSAFAVPRFRYVIF